MPLWRSPLPPLLALALALAALLVPAGRAEEPAAPRRDRHGDPLPEGALARMGTVRLRHEHPVTDLAFSPDGKTLVTVGQDADLVFWDPATGKEVRRVPRAGPRGVGFGNRGVCFSADGRHIVTGGMDGAIRFVDATTGKEERVLQGQHRGWIMGLALAPDGKSLVTADYSGTILLWDVAGGNVRHRFPTGPRTGRPIALAFLPDGKSFVATWSDETARLVDANSGKEVRTFAPAPGGPSAGLGTALALSPDGKRLALGGGWGRPGRVFEVATGKEVTSLPSPAGQVQSLAFLPGGRFLALASSGSAISIRGLASGKELRRLEAPSGGNTVLALSPDGKTLAAASGTTQVRLWDIASGRALLPSGGHQGWVQNLAFLPDGKRLVSGGADQRTFLWDVATGRELAEHRFLSSNSLTVASDGRTVLALGYDRAIHSWRPGADGKAAEVGRRELALPNPAQMVLSPDGKALALVGYDRKVRVRDLGTGKERELPGQPNYPSFLVLSPDGRRLAVGTGAGLQVWDRVSGAEFLTRGAGGAAHLSVVRVAFGGDGRSLLTFDGSTLRVYELASGRERCHVPGTGVSLHSLVCSADGLLAARGNNDGTVQVYATATGKEVMRFAGQQGPVQALTFSRDGRLLASGGANGTILVWRVPDGARPPRADLAPADRLALWRDLADPDAARSFRAVLALAADPGPAVPFLKEHLKPRPAPDARRLERLIADLDHDDFEVREKATQELAEIGADAEAALLKAKESTSAEVRNRAEGLLRRLGEGGVASERLRFVRAVEVLERAGTPEARRALADLLKGSLEPVAEQEVQASLERLGAGGRPD
jgi:WD40 repeat protein